MTQDQIEKQVNVNLLGSISLTKAVLPLIKEAKGKYSCCQPSQKQNMMLKTKRLLYFPLILMTLFLAYISFHFRVSPRKEETEK